LATHEHFQAFGKIQPRFETHVDVASVYKARC
jgi:hypothetical protein